MGQAGATRAGHNVVEFETGGPDLAANPYHPVSVSIQIIVVIAYEISTVAS